MKSAEITGVAHVLKNSAFALLIIGAVYLFMLRNRKIKFEVEFELDPQETKED